MFAPIFSPLGFGSYGVVACLLCGVVAKEVTVGTMGILNNVTSAAISSTILISQSLLISTSAISFNTCSAISFLVFAMLYCPCISTIAVMKKEIGTKWTLLALVLQLIIAYIVSYVVYKIALSFSFNGIIYSLIALLIFSLIFISLIVLVEIIKKKKYCKFCPNKKHCAKVKNEDNI